MIVQALIDFSLRIDDIEKFHFSLTMSAENNCIGNKIPLTIKTSDGQIIRAYGTIQEE